jgi:hypothetical protein
VNNEVILADPILPSLDEQGVTYMLDRIQHDSDLRYLMLHTQAFHLLCQAEAARTGESLEQVEVRRSTDARPKYRQRPPRLLQVRKCLEAVGLAAERVLARFGPVDLSKPHDGLRDLRNALDACEREWGPA